jgi:tRNA C32,U32 (ribose-2'-O)-methylase TrmJ
MTVPSAKGYRTLNLSHAVAIVLYAIFVSGKAEKFKSAKPKTKKRLLIKFAGIIEKARSIDNREKVGASAKALVSRALISESEAKAMLALLSEIERR